MSKFAKLKARRQVKHEAVVYVQETSKLKIPEEIPREVQLYIRAMVDRYVWVRSDQRKQALAKNRISRGVYVCDCCGEHFGPKEIEVEHPVPRIEPGVGFNDIHTYLRRTFVDSDFLRVVCRECHKDISYIQQHPKDFKDEC
jgi:5-methylcytosine-specific restriction endonuclease McrA